MTGVTNHPTRLADHFRAEARARGLPWALHVEECLVFGDLEWSPRDPDALDPALRDPAVLVFGRTRYVALGRIAGELRYFAAPVPPGTDFAKRDPVLADQLAAELDVQEAGVLDSVAGAVDFVDAYLDGQEPSTIMVRREIRRGSAPAPACG